MNDVQSLSHSKWRCKYHIVFAPKYRRQIVYGKIKADVGKILRELSERKGVEILEAECCPDHIHMLVAIPPHLSVAPVHGISQKQEQPDDIRSACEFEIQIWKSAFLVQRVLCRYSREV